MPVTKYPLPPVFETDQDSDSDTQHLLTSEKLPWAERRQSEWNKGLLVVNGLVFVLNIAFLVLVGVPGVVHKGPGPVPPLPHQGLQRPLKVVMVQKHCGKADALQIGLILPSKWN